VGTSRAKSNLRRLFAVLEINVVYEFIVDDVAQLKWLQKELSDFNWLAIKATYSTRSQAFVVDMERLGFVVTEVDAISTPIVFDDTVPTTQQTNQSTREDSASFWESLFGRSTGAQTFCVVSIAVLIGLAICWRLCLVCRKFGKKGSLVGMPDISVSIGSKSIDIYRNCRSQSVRSKIKCVEKLDDLTAPSTPPPLPNSCSSKPLSSF
jgi:hypothetical protein